MKIFIGKINEDWNDYYKTVATCHLVNYGFIVLNEDETPIDNEFFLEQLTIPEEWVYSTSMDCDVEFWDGTLVDIVRKLSTDISYISDPEKGYDHDGIFLCSVDDNNDIFSIQTSFVSMFETYTYCVQKKSSITPKYI